MKKIFRGLVDSIYKKFELYLYRLFRLSKYLENTTRYSRINTLLICEILDPYGTSQEGFSKLPPNPFVIKEEDWDLFSSIFSEFECHSDNNKSLVNLQIQVWQRIKEIKIFLGITKYTRFIGEENADKRLVNEIDVYLIFPESLTQIHRLVLGEHPESDKDFEKFKDELHQFQNFLLDRERIKGIKSYRHYKN